MAALPLVISLGAHPSSTDGLAARQTTIVDNTTNGYRLIHVYPKVKLGGSPVAGKSVFFWLIKDDGGGTPNRTDGAGPSDAALTIKNAELLFQAGTTATGGENIQPHFTIENPGPKWGLAIGHNTGANLDGTAGNHVINWVGENPEVS